MCSKHYIWHATKDIKKKQGEEKHKILMGQDLLLILLINTLQLD